MNITRRTDYAIHLLADLSESTDRPVGLRNLAEKHDVTYAFARTVQQGLLKAGLIKTTRGITGGIQLAKPLEKISLLEVFEAAQNPLDHAFSNDKAPWNYSAAQRVSPDVWKSTKSVLSDHLAGIKMNHILEAEPKKRRRPKSKTSKAN